LPFANDVQAQVRVLKGWKDFGSTDFARLKQICGVTWVIVQQPQSTVVKCLYRNSLVAVCLTK